MSKSRGNDIDPWTILRSRGADALRWYFFSAGSPWTNRRVSEEGIDESTRRFFLTLWNTYAFFVTYANLDGWEPARRAAPRHVLDRWARSRLHATVRDVTDALESFDALGAAQALETFVDDLSNWYVRRSRPRFWKAADADAHATLHECLATVAKLLAPLCPFVSDELHRTLARASESVHLADWPEVDAGAIDPSLEEAITLVRQLVTLGRAARTEAKLKVRQPLHRALVVMPDGSALPSELVDEMADELNVKRVEMLDDLEGLLDEHAVPNFRRLGPKAGKNMPRLKEVINEVDVGELRAAFGAAGHYTVELADGAQIDIEPEDVEIRASEHQELALARDGGYAVALDTTIDDDLRLEGIARELSRGINDLRRTLGFELSDRIRVEIVAEGIVAEAAERFGDWIAGEVLADGWTVVASLEQVPDDVSWLELDAGRAALRLERV
jgi:isoleucyl-tRNA synthetase